MSRVYNFSAGPAVLPEEVLQEVAAEMMDYNGTGMSVMEMSHRSKAFEEIIQKGLRMIGQGMHGFVGNRDLEFGNLEEELSHPTDLRIFAKPEVHGHRRLKKKTENIISIIVEM